MTACVLYFLYFFFIIIPPPHTHSSLGPATTYSWKSIDPTKIICKKSICPVLVCTGPSPRINIARSLKSRRGKNKNLTAQKSNSNTVWFNFQTYIYIYLHTSSIVIDRYSNFGNTYLSKEFARVLGPGQIVTSLEHLNPGLRSIS